MNQPFYKKSWFILLRFYRK